MLFRVIFLQAFLHTGVRETVHEIEVSDKDTFVLFFNKVAPSWFPHIPALFLTRWKKDNSILHKDYEQEYQSRGQQEMQIFNKTWTTDPQVQWAAMPDQVIVMWLT